MNDEMNVLTEAIPQTEMESTEILDQVSEGEAQTAFSQTDSEMESTEALTSEDDAEGAEEVPILQTDSESANIPAEEAPKARSRRSRKSQSEESASGGETAKPAAPRRRRAKAKPTAVSIDGQLSVETEADKARDALLDLVESMKTKRILTGTIQGVERPTDNPTRSLAVLYHGDFKIMIPAEEAVEIPDDLRVRSKEEVLHYTLTKRLGAEVDYIVKGIDGEAGIAVASRLEAMAARRRSYYFGTDRDGNNLLYEGVCAEARVVSVIRAGIFVDLFGLETYIPLRELSYQRMLDASGVYQPGQRILVKILRIDRSDREHIRVAASIKQAGENPYEKALRRYSVGNRYVGTVSMVDTTGVFVALDGGIDCLCSYPKRGRPPRGARVTIRILGINHETNRIWGAITHVATPR